MSTILLDTGLPCGECGGDIDGPEDDGTPPMAVNVVTEDDETIPTQYHGHCTPEEVLEQITANFRAGEL